MDFDWGSFFGDVAKSVAGAGASAAIGYALSKDQRKDAEKATKQAEKATEQAGQLTALQTDIAKEQWDRYKEIYEPLERKIVEDSLKVTTPGEYDKAASLASSTVASQFGKAKERLRRTPGMDPSSGAYQSGMLGLDLTQAAADAVAQNNARENVKNTGYNRQITALSLGKGLDSTAANGLMSAANANNNLAGRSQIMAGQANNQGMQLAQVGGSLVSRMMDTPMVKNWLSGGAPKATESELATAFNAPSSYATPDQMATAFSSPSFDTDMVWGA